MPKVNLPEALRYFFTPFVIGFYYCIFDPACAKELVKQFGAIPAVAFLVAGIPFYYFLSLCDLQRPDNASE